MNDIDTYNEWISKNYPTKSDCVNKCNEAVYSMTQHFKELSVQVGYCNNRYHCWCKDQHGTIIDPTLKQFDSDVIYTPIANRFLRKDEIEMSTGAIFMDDTFEGDIYD